MDSPQLYIAALLQVARDRDVDLGAPRPVSISWEQYKELSTKLVDVTGDPHIGLEIGGHINLSAHGALGYASLSCGTVAESLELLTKYGPFRKQGARVELAFSKETMAVTYWPPAKIRGAPSFFIDMFFSAFERATYELTGEKMTRARLELSIPSPRHQDPRYKKYIAANIRFSCPVNRLVGPISNYTKVLSASQIPATAIHKRICEDYLRSSVLGESIAEGVKLHLLGNGAPFPDISEVSTELGFSQRTLRRRLSEEGTNFQNLLDEVRNFLATEYLSGTDLSVEAVAAALGYANHTNFRRAFIKWNQTTPGAFRKALRENTSGSPLSAVLPERRR
ncbi:MAG: AraC family transcriptional regulator ligand-binding domain-containing protein [Rhodobiaceae bacterium]|nr:AraC family transcriptional regulator ligand-binding domain-containing protein [Rhodobiaceae bacterium]